jgi:Skp family chaperone for outer membrane proteins
MKRILLPLLAAAAIAASADARIAAVDFGLVVLAHPQTPQNRAELLDMQTKFIKERDDRLAARNRMRSEFEAAREIALDPVQGAAARDQASAKAKDLQMQYARATEEVEELVADRRRKLQRREGELFADVMIDIRAKIEEIAKAKGYDLVVDRKSANLASGVPTPVFLYASDAIDVTDDVIAAIGGSREQAEKDQEALLDRAGAIFSGTDGPESAAPEAPAAAPAAAPAPAPEAK